MRGFSLAEVLMTFVIVASIMLIGVCCMKTRSLELMAVREDLRLSIVQAFTLARAQGSDVVVALGDDHQSGVIPVVLPRHVTWGKPSGIPLPPGMTQPTQADTRGQAHPRITVTPRHTATASAWFVNDGDSALCMRLSGEGHLQMLSWSSLTKTWSLD